EEAVYPTGTRPCTTKAFFFPLFDISFSISQDQEQANRWFGWSAHKDQEERREEDNHHICICFSLDSLGLHGILSEGHRLLCSCCCPCLLSSPGPGREREIVRGREREREGRE
uniref:Uncharacterized protein n=1 Tax=Oryza brachyantha TaxID=4533 RepID=J3LA90_ORYBR